MSLAQDVRYATRSLWTSRGFAAVAILCLGLGIGVNTTIFSIVDGVLLKDFPYTDPQRLVVLSETNDRLGVTQSGTSYRTLQDWKASTAAFETIAASQGRSLTVSDGGEPERYLGAAISWDLFPMLGIAPVAGQGFRPEDDRPGAPGVVLLSHEVWTRRYGADPDVIGRRILVNAAPAVIVGVMPPRFQFPQNQKLWVPLAPIAAEAPRNARGLFTFGRLRPGVTPERADAELAAAAARVAGEHPDTNDGWSARTRPLREVFIPQDVSLVIWLMMAAVTLVLLIACSNVANLLLARASVRRREFALRAALGAGRGRIVRQLLTESVVLSLASVPFGIALAFVGTRLIAGEMPPDQVPYYITWAVDGRTLAYAIGVAFVTAAVFGLAPALQAARGGLQEALKEGVRGSSARRSRLRSGLVVAQVALALVALVGALLFVRTFQNLDSYDVGFDTRPLMTLRIFLPGEAYEPAGAKARRVQDILDRLERISGVEAAFASNLVPVSGGGGGANIVIDGQPWEPGREPGIGFTGVTPHFTRTLGVAVRPGRDFTDAESWARTPVAVINETMARRFWPEGNPVGARFRQAGAGAEPDWFTIIGVVADIKHDDIDSDDVPFPVAYVPYPFQETLNTGFTIRVAGPDPAAITTAARDAIRAADPVLPVFQVRTMEEVRRIGFWQYGLFGWIFGTVGVVGLLLASIGVYGVLAYAVSQRTQEIGVRVALGAARRDVLRLIVGQGVALAAVGVGVGLALAPLGTWFGRSLFYNVSPFDPLSFAAVALFLLAVAGAASYLPARRATRVDPLIALRTE